MTEKEVAKSVSLKTSLGMTNRKLLETYDIEIQPIRKRTSLKIRQLVEAMDEEEISFHEQTAQNQVIESRYRPRGHWKCEKNNYIDITQRQNALREIEMQKPTLTVWTDGSTMGEKRGVGVYCKVKGFKGLTKDQERCANLIGWAVGDRNCNEFNISTRRTKGCHTHWLDNGMPNTDEGDERKPTQ
jgi:hypothetical protein